LLTLLALWSREQTTGQAPQSQQEPSAQQGKQGQSQQRSQGQKQREQTTGDADLRAGRAIA